MSKELAVTITSQDKQMEITESMIKDYLCPTANRKEIFMFLQLCQAQGLNPFIGEAYLIKYGNDVQMIVGKETFLKRAENNPDFDGFEAGVITESEKTGELKYRKGSFYSKKSEELLGAWAEIKKKSLPEPLRIEIPLDEYVKKNKEGKPIMSWRTMPGTMIRKVALVQALREAFPNALSACYISEELSNKDESEEATVTHEVVEEKEAVQSVNETEPETPVEVVEEEEPVNVDSKIPMVETEDGLQHTEEAVINDIKYRVKNCLTISELENLWNEQKETINKLSLGHNTHIKTAFKERKALIEASQKKEPEALPVNPEFEETETHPEFAKPKNIEPNSLEEQYKKKNLTALRNILRTKLHEWCDKDDEIRRFIYQHVKKEVLARLTKPEAIKMLLTGIDEFESPDDEPYIIRDFSKESASVIAEEIERALQEAGLNLNDKENLLYEFTDGFELKELTQKKAFSVYEKVVNHLKEIEEKNMLKKQ